jgi:hypothetical protein
LWPVAAEPISSARCHSRFVFVSESVSSALNSFNYLANNDEGGGGGGGSDKVRERARVSLPDRAVALAVAGRRTTNCLQHCKGAGSPPAPTEADKVARECP